MDQQLDVVVVGSANLDVVLRVPAIPRPGETVLAHTRTTGPGGKGANQAVAAARLGARTAFVGAVGADDAGEVVRSELAAAGVLLGALTTASTPTGTAYVVVERGGENAIVVDPGANTGLELDEAQLEHVARATVLLCQLEVPLAAVAAALGAARGLRVVNAAPALPLPTALTDLVDVLVVNEQEALAVVGGEALTDAVPRLLERVPEVVVTLGSAGALVARRGADVVRVPGVPAREVVDTTGAGDTFCGAYSAARAAGRDDVAAVEQGCAAASLSVEVAGAARAAPLLADVLARLRTGGALGRDVPAPRGLGLVPPVARPLPDCQVGRDADADAIGASPLTLTECGAGHRGRAGRCRRRTIPVAVWCYALFYSTSRPCDPVC